MNDTDILTYCEKCDCVTLHIVSKTGKKTCRDCGHNESIREGTSISKGFTVKFKDLAKDPNLSLSATNIAKNKKIPKKYFRM